MIIGSFQKVYWSSCQLWESLSPQRSVTSSSEEVGWMATVLSKSAFVAPIFTATANPCSISSHPIPCIWIPTTWRKKRAKNISDLTTSRKRTSLAPIGKTDYKALRGPPSHPPHPSHSEPPQVGGLAGAPSVLSTQHALSFTHVVSSVCTIFPPLF